MIQGTRHDIAGVGVDAVDYDGAVERIIRAGRECRPFAVSALAVHGVMCGVRDPQQRVRLNALDLVCPDGQPVRWALNLLHGTGLVDRVCGPELTWRVCQAAAREGLPVFFYGSEPDVLESLVTRLTDAIPTLEIAGSEASKFRQTSDEEQIEIARRIVDSGARIVFAGLGCPRQEVFAYEYRDLLGLPVLAVGAAFDFHAGRLKRVGPRVQRFGLEWLYRLVQEPRRLWRRYLILNPWFVFVVARQRIRGQRPTDEPQPVVDACRYG